MAPERADGSRGDELLDYVLGLLPPAESAALAERLETDPALRGELRALQDGFAELVLALPPAEVPAGAGDRLLARLNAGTEAGERTPVASRPVARRPVPGRSGPRRWVLPAVLLAAAAVLGALTLPSLLRGPADTLARYQEAPGAVPGTVTGKAGQVLARVVRLPGGQAYVQMSAAAPAGRIYQAWRVQGGKPVSLGTFDGRGFLATDLPPQSVFAVSVEPPGGSPQPTTTPLFAQAL